MQVITKNRDNTVDILRGFAILMVVFGHTMTGCTTGAEHSFLFNVIWSLQMPLFFIISGYVNKYSRGIADIKSLGKYILRRTIAYMSPWIIWTILVRGILFQQRDYLNIPKLLYSMDSGYWFLFSLYCISIIFGVSLFLAQKCTKTHNANIINGLTILFFLFGAGIFALIGFKMGFSFLCLKLTLYYMPFYLMGYVFGKYQNNVLSWRWGRLLLDISVLVSCFIWLFCLVRFDLYQSSHGLKSILIRCVASVCGCITICGLLPKAVNRSKYISKWFSWSGKHSLEIYLVHSLLLSLLRFGESPNFENPLGVLIVLINFILTTVLVSLVIRLLQSNKLIQKILFGK